MADSIFPNAVSASDEWSPLKSVLVGRAENSCFPSEPAHMIHATMPDGHREKFKARSPFPPDIVAAAQDELDNVAAILMENQIKVYRPQLVDWLKHGGYTSSMVRDGLLVVGNTVIESCYSWACRRDELKLTLGGLLDALEATKGVRVVRAPPPPQPDNIYDNVEGTEWSINDARPAFDAADFMRFGKTVLVQRSHVTNKSGIAYVKAAVPEGYSVEEVDVDDSHAMHIDCTLLPLREGLLVYNPTRVSEAALRRIEMLRDWELVAYPGVPQERKTGPPLFMTSPWIALNVLSIDEQRVLVEEQEVEVEAFLRKLGLTPIMCPFRNVNSLGGSFHCATVDLVREAS